MKNDVDKFLALGDELLESLKKQHAVIKRPRWNHAYYRKFMRKFASQGLRRA